LDYPTAVLPARRSDNAPSLEILRTKDLEASNEIPLNDAAAVTRERAMTEYEKSSRRAISLVNAIRRSPAARLRFPSRNWNVIPSAS
jgi:hypothetical protein